jgi:hypothetical protein
MNSLAGSLIGWLVIPKAKHVSVAFPIVSLTHSERRRGGISNKQYQLHTTNRQQSTLHNRYKKQI